MEDTLVEKYDVEDIWRHWAIVFSCFVVIYTIIYQFAFRRQLSRYIAKTSKPTNNEKSNGQTDTQISPVNLDEMPPLNIDETQRQHPSKRPQKQKDEPVNPGSCMKFANCTVSSINATICTSSSLLLLHPPYWNDPIYGTPLPLFYITAITQAYFFVDLLCEIVVFYTYALPQFRWDTLVHHGGILIYMFWILLPEPIYAWIITEIAFAMEFSTLFLNLSFFAKWYHVKANIIQKFRYGFVVAWFLVRVPGTIGIFIWIVFFGERIIDEYPLDKVIGILYISIANVLLQGLWTVMIVMKTYHALCGQPKVDVDGTLKTPPLNLKRRNSIEITNVTSEA